MTRDRAEEFARVLFDDHPAAVSLLMEATEGATAGRRARSWAALLVLDPDEPPPPSPELIALVDAVVGLVYGNRTEAKLSARLAITSVMRRRAAA